MRKLLLATTALLGLAASPASAAVVADVGVNPTSSAGAFANMNPANGAFSDQYTFQLVGGNQFFTIGSATNTYSSATDFIANFTGRVYEIVGIVGGGDDTLVLGPATATPGNCGPGLSGVWRLGDPRCG